MIIAIDRVEVEFGVGEVIHHIKDFLVGVKLVQAKIAVPLTIKVRRAIGPCSWPAAGISRVGDFGIFQISIQVAGNRLKLPANVGFRVNFGLVTARSIAVGDQRSEFSIFIEHARNSHSRHFMKVAVTGSFWPDARLIDTSVSISKCTPVCNDRFNIVPGNIEIDPPVLFAFLVVNKNP